MSRAYDGFHKIDIIRAKVKGKVVRREKLILPSAVAALVINESNKMALVIQHRPAVGHETHEIPAGVLDKSISPIATLHEELLEECGIDKRDIIYTSPTPIDKYYMYVGGSDATLSLYLVRVKNQLKDVVIVPDSDVEKTIWLTLKQVQHLNTNGDIRDPKTLLAISHFESLFVTPVTEKQQLVIDLIARTTGKIFKGNTLEQARVFISENIDDSKRIAKSSSPIGHPFSPAHAEAYSFMAQMDAVRGSLEGNPDIDIDFDANALMRKTIESSLDALQSLPKCVNCGQQYHNDHANLCSDCYQLEWGTMGDVTGERQNNGHYGMPDPDDVDNPFGVDTKFVGGGLDRDDEEDPDVGF